jgi:flagellar biosynthesis protein FlhG
MISDTKQSLMLAFNQTANYKTGETITNSLIQLASKNKLNRKFMVKYIGNIVLDLNIQTTSRLRKLFTKEFVGSKASVDLNKVVNNLEKIIS